jgi:deoxyadenosine/deoxycytidine kinase
MDKKLAFELLRLFQMPDLLVYVYADTETIKKRLLQRRKRTRILETDDLETEIRRNEVQFRELIRLMIDNDAIEKENVIYIDNN